MSKPSLVRASSKGVAERFRRQYRLDEGRDFTLWDGRSTREMYQRLVALGDNATPEAVATVTGNKTWSYFECGCCGKYFEVGILLGSEDEPFYLCAGCVSDSQALLNDK